MKSIKHWVFWPPFLILIGSMAYSLLDAESFSEQTKFLNAQLLEHFGWLFSVSTLCFLGICIWVYFSPLANIRIGGKDAKPILTKWRWFAITLCTTVAVGILFWGTAEPLMHYQSPPQGLGIAPNSPDSARFAMSTMFMHWTFIPYGIYALAGLMFALTYYNLKQPFSLGSMLYPLIGERAYGPLGNAVDAICLYSLVAGMAASLGAGILSLVGGMESVLGVPDAPWVLALVAILIVGTFILSAASGLLKGIRILSDINIKAFFGFSIFVFIFGPTTYILSFGFEGLGEFLQTFFQRSLYTGTAAGDSWPKDWTIFYWANWLAWTPVTALFLGRLSVGYTVRDFLNMNLIYPSIFGCLWMMIFSGTSLYMDIHSVEGGLATVLAEKGFENVMYAVFDRLPLSTVTSIIFILVTFLSYVTAADSNTSAMSGLSSSGISPESPEPSFWIKIIWGSIVGLIAWVMVSQADIEGIL